ncbi:glycosyltransferase family 2 protein [Rhodococcus sp. 3A]
MASHNRGALTEQCVRSILQQISDEYLVRVWVADASSNSDTRERLSRVDGPISVERVPAKWFWAQSMSHVEVRALGDDPQIVVWINDDVALADDALARLISSWQSRPDRSNSVVVGSMRDAEGSITYGGIRLGYPITRWEHIVPASEPILADAANGNLLLIPTELLRRIGGLDSEFEHSYADFDWTLRAHRAGAEIVVAPGWFGLCERNPVGESYQAPSITLSERYRRVLHTKGLPWRSHYRYLRRHAGAIWPVLFAYPYLRISIDHLLRRF